KAIEPSHDWKEQKAGPESTTGTGPESTTGNGQLPDRNPPLREGDYRTGIHHSYLESSGEVGGGGRADCSVLSVSPPAPLSEGAGPGAPSPPPSDGPSITAPSTGRFH